MDSDQVIINMDGETTPFYPSDMMDFASGAICSVLDGAWWIAGEIKTTVMYPITPSQSQWW
jgi:hypothetical protein